MDTSILSHVSLCAGYGGIDLGLRRAVPRLRTIAYSEIEGYACANLVAKIEAGLLDPAPIWTDVKSFPYRQFHGCVHILSGGYPCQPFSAAGKRLGRNDPRHLWPWIADGIALMRPTLCFFENVEGHITLGLRDVLNDLGELGYRATWGVFSASEVGAPHQRKRVFILAHGNSERGQIQDWWRLAAKPLPFSHGTTGRDAWPSRPGEGQHGWEPPRVVSGLADTTSAGSRSKGGDAICQGRTASEAGGTGIPQDTKREAGPAISDDQSAGRNGATPRVVANTKLAVDRSEAGRDQVDQSDAKRPAGWIGGSSQGMGHSTRWEDDGRESGDLGQTSGEGRCVDHAINGASEDGGLADSLQRRSDWWADRISGRIGKPSQNETNNGKRDECKAEPPLGRDPNGSSRGLDNGHLFTSTCNRTDELRLLGNGVVPATAALAFTTLLKELI